MSEDTKVEGKLEFETMPGADRPEEATEVLDLNFEEVEATDEVEETEAEDTTEEPVAEEEQEETTAEVEEEEVTEEEPVAEVEEEPVAEAEEPESKKPMVPKTRLDEVLAKQRALEKQLDAMKAAKQKPEEAPEEYDFGEKELEYQNLLLDGEAEKAAQLRAEIRKAERTQIEFELSDKFEKQYDQNQQMTALQQAAADLESSFPVFSEKSDSYNEEYTNEVVDLRDAFMMKGDNAVTALSKAAKYVITEYNLDPVEEKSSLSQPNKKSIVDEVAKKRAEVSKKLKAAEKQPPELPGEGSSAHGEKPIDFSQMSEDEFNALPEATLRRLRGDIL